MKTIQKILDVTEMESPDELVGKTFDNYNSRIHEPIGNDEYKFTVRNINLEEETIELEWHVSGGTRVRESEDSVEEVSIDDMALIATFKNANFVR